MNAQREPEPFDPLKQRSSEATDLDLASYLETTLGWDLIEIRNITTALARDGAAHEVFEELIARRRRAH